MDSSCLVVLLLSLFVFVVVVESWVESYQSEDFQQVKQLVIQWAPLIWMSPDETHFPTSVDKFLQNVHLVDDTGKAIFSRLNETHFPRIIDSTGYFLVTKTDLNLLKKQVGKSLLNGDNPKENYVPIYAVVTWCTPHVSFHSSNGEMIRNDIDVMYNKVKPKLFFHVSYWLFYPYNSGKTFCFLGKVPTITLFGTCFGRHKIIGSHVGDWEHLSLSFKGNLFPSELYLAVHDAGGYYRYNPLRKNFKFDSQRKGRRNVQKPKFAPIVRMQGGHPVLFAAEGSHGLWSSPGEHEYVKIPKLTDKCGYGIPWKTWMDVRLVSLGVEEIPLWMKFRGKWGNPKSNCVLFKKLGFCEHTDGPYGILRNDREFYC